MVIHRSVGEWIEVIGIGNGKVIKIREDSSRRPIYTVQLDDSSLTPDGIIYTRAEEMRFAPTFENPIERSI